MKESISHYIATHTADEKPFSDGWTKTTFDKGEPTLLGHRIDLRVYKNEKLGITFYIYTELDVVNLEVDIPSDMLSVRNHYNFMRRLIDATKIDAKLVLSQNPPMSALSFKSLTLVLVDNPNEMSLCLVNPELNLLESYVVRGDYRLNRQKQEEMKNALAENDQIKIAELISEECGIEVNPFKWSIRCEMNGRTTISSDALKVFYMQFRESVRTIQNEFPNIPDEIVIDINQFIDESKDYYVIRRKAFIDHFHEDPTKVASYLQRIFKFHCSWFEVSISEDTKYSLDYILNLLVWYLGNRCYSLVACIYHEMKKTLPMERVTVATYACRCIATHSLLGVSQADRDKYLPFFCEAAIDAARYNWGTAIGYEIAEYAIKLLNELSRGDDFKVPSDIGEFNIDEFKSSFILPLAQKLGEARARLANQSQQNKVARGDVGIIVQNERIDTEHDGVELLNPSTSRRLQFSDRSCFKTPSGSNKKCTIL